MTSTSTATGPAPDGNTYRWSGRCSAQMRWKPLEIVAVVIGFMIHWPIGLAILGIVLAKRRGYTLDSVIGRLRDTVQGFGSQGARSAQWRPFASTGNTAFDDWRSAELAKLEEERRKLDAAQREFADHMSDLRRARDREEFDRFMAARAAGSAAPQA